jgi:hypothetical protein
LAYSKCPGAVGVDGWDAGMVDSVQAEMHGEQAGAHVGGGKVLADMHLGVATPRNHAGAGAEAVEHGYCSTCLQHLLPVAVRGQWSPCLDARQHCWVSLGRAAGAAAAEGSCCFQQRPGVVVLDTNKMVYERGCSAKMCLVGVVAEVGEVEDTDRTLADFYQLSSGPPVREQVDVEVDAVGHIDNLLRACCMVDSNQLHKRARSVAAEEAVRNGHSRLRHSGAGVDTGRHSVADNAHIGVDAGVGAGDAEEARLTDTVYGMVEEEDVWDVWEQIEVGEPSNGEEVDAEGDEQYEGPAGERDVEVAAAVDRTYGVVAAAVVADTQMQWEEAVARWPWSEQGRTR